MATLYLAPVILYYTGKKTGRVDFDYRRRRVLVYQYKGIEFFKYVLLLILLSIKLNFRSGLLSILWPAFLFGCSCRSLHF